MVLINGQPGSVVDISDRGFQYGDGLFETILIRDNKPIFLAEHLQRLMRGCRALGIPPPEHQMLSDEARHLSRQATGPAVLKIMVTRGAGGRGYKQPETVNPTRVLSLHPFPDYPADYAKKGIKTRFCHTRLGLNPALAGLKHLNRLEQVIARAEWQDSDIQEGIMLGHDGYVREGTMTNIFFVKNRRLFTPDLSQAGIAGIIRGLVLSSEHGANASVMATREYDLLNADEIFVCNSIVGVWPVVQLEKWPFPVGPTTRQIQTWLKVTEHENTLVGH